MVFDPKGDADLLRAVREACRLAGRAGDFVLFHLGYPELSSRYNGVGQFHRVTEVATRLSGQVSGEGQSAVFREFVWRFVNVVARAVTALGQRQDYRTILRHVTNIEALCLTYAEAYFEGRADVLDQVAALERRRDAPPRHMEGRPRRLVAFEQVMLERGLGDEVLGGLRSAMRYEKSYFDKLVASLLPLLEKLTTGKAAALLSPDYLDMDDPRPRGQRTVLRVEDQRHRESPCARGARRGAPCDAHEYATDGEAPGQVGQGVDAQTRPSLGRIQQRGSARTGRTHAPPRDPPPLGAGPAGSAHSVATRLAYRPLRTAHRLATAAASAGAEPNPPQIAPRAGRSRRCAGSPRTGMNRRKGPRVCESRCFPRPRGDAP